MHAAPGTITLTQAFRESALTCKLVADGRNQLDLGASNSGDAPIRIDIPAGLVCQSKAGGRMIVLHAAQLEVGPHGSSDAQIPTVDLSPKDAPAAASLFEPTAETEAKLDPLLKYLSTRTDVPRTTSQLMVFAILDDMKFGAWEQFLAALPKADEAGQVHPTPSEITQAIDALGVLREIFPGRTFALETDPELKMRALRNPVCRPKAMQLYGMTIPGDAPAGAVPPDLGQLLHTKAGDNCPICRMRQQMQGSPSDL